MEQIQESKWNPIALKEANGNTTPYKINSYAISSSWYNKIVQNDGSRQTRLRNYHEADCNSVEISRALDILAEDISSSNADDTDQFYLEFEDDSKVKKTIVKLLEGALKLWENRTEMDEEFFNRVRRTLKFGATFYRKNRDGTLTELPTERMVGYILSDDDEEFVTHYLYDKTINRIDNKGRIFNTRTMATNNEKYEPISIDDLLVLKIGNHPFGESVIEKVYNIWKTMKLIEDSVVIYRVTRSYERRVYYIDVGNLQGAKREAAIEKQRIRLMQKHSNKSGDLTMEYDPHSMGEDIFVPTNSTGKGSRVETLQGGGSLGELTDLEWFNKKLAAGLRIPPSMIDINDQSQTQFSDMRVGQMYMIEMRYLGHVKRLKRQIQFDLSENFTEFCAIREIKKPEDAKFKISDSMSFSEYKEIELNQTKLNVANSTQQLPALSGKFVLQKYMNLDKDDMLYNEECKLREKGLNDEQIKNIEDFEKDQIIYGKPTAAVATKYGLEVDEMGGRF